jgi:hypothetical protein
LLASNLNNTAIAISRMKRRFSMCISSRGKKVTRVTSLHGLRSFSAGLLPPGD